MKYYGEVYSNEFLDLFDKDKESFSNIELKTYEYRININKILETLGFETTNDEKPRYQEEKTKTIYLPKLFLNYDDEAYLKAHQIALYLLDYRGGISSFEEKKDKARELTLELLLPEKLLRKILNKIMSDFYLDVADLKTLKEGTIISYISSETGLSKDLIKKRLNKLNI